MLTRYSFTQSTPIKRLQYAQNFSTLPLLTLGVGSLLWGHRLCCRVLGSVLGSPYPLQDAGGNSALLAQKSVHLSWAIPPWKPH